MSHKPTYEELEKRIRELEKESGLRKEAEKALRERDKRVSEIIQMSSIPTFVIDNMHIITHWNKACENLTGISSNEVMGTRNQWLPFYPEERPTMADLIVDNGTEAEISKYYGRKYGKSNIVDGGYECEDFFPDIGDRGRWLFFTAAPLRDAEGKVIGAIENFQDTTERNMAVKEMHKSIHQLGERVKELNCLFGISKLAAKADISFEEILQGVVNLIPPSWQHSEVTCARVILEDQEFRTENFQETIWKQSSYIIVHGEQFGVLDVFYLEERPEEDEGPFLSEERNLIDSIASRVGKSIERYQAEEALLKSEKRFRDLVESSLIGIAIIQDDKTVYKNFELETLLGSLSKSFRLANFEGIHPDDAKKVRESFQSLKSKKTRSLDMDFRFFPAGTMDKKVDMKWVYCRASIIEYEGKDAILINMMDMTRAKELERLLIIQDKMASLGHVAAGIAHEIRNPLSGINIYLRTLEKIIEQGKSLDKVKEIFSQLKSASSKIESVIKRVMDFSKPNEPRLVLTDINRPIEEAMNLSSVTLRKSGVKFEVSLAEELPLCYADPHLIEEVILNLINNAADAMKQTDKEKNIGITSGIEDNRVVVRLFDSGPGVPIELRDSIFDPFYTTKEDSSGIGLSICHRIVTDHGGTLDVETSKYGGAEFVCRIPIKTKKGRK